MLTGVTFEKAIDYWSMKWILKQITGETERIVIALNAKKKSN